MSEEPPKPFLEITDEIELATEGERLTQFLSRTGAAKSNADARRLIEQGGITIDGEKVTDINYRFENIPLWGLRVMKSRRWIRNVQPYLGPDSTADTLMWNMKQPDGRMAIDVAIQGWAADQRALDAIASAVERDLKS